MTDSDKFDNIIRAQFGDKDAAEMLARAQQHEVDLDAGMRIPRKEMIRLATRLIKSIQRSLAENQGDLTTGMLAFGWLSACETIMTLADEMPDVDYEADIAAVRTKVAEARAIDSELITTLQETRADMEQGDISWTDIHDRLGDMLAKITTIPGGN